VLPDPNLQARVLAARLRAAAPHHPSQPSPLRASFSPTSCVAPQSLNQDSINLDPFLENCLSMNPSYRFIHGKLVVRNDGYLLIDFIPDLFWFLPLSRTCVQMHGPDFLRDFSTMLTWYALLQIW
jgi:hypothetical protein